MEERQGRDWIEYIVDKIHENYKDRKVVLWGKYTISDNISERLEEKYKILTAFCVESDSSKVDNKNVFFPSYLAWKSSEYYVVIPLAFYPSIREKLIGGGV